MFAFHNFGLELHGFHIVTTSFSRLNKYMDLANDIFLGVQFTNIDQF